MSSTELPSVTQYSAKAVETFRSAALSFNEEDCLSIRYAKNKDELAKAYQTYLNHRDELETLAQQMSQGAREIASILSITRVYHENISKIYGAKSMVFEVDSLLLDNGKSIEEVWAEMPMIFEVWKAQFSAETGYESPPTPADPSNPGGSSVLPETGGDKDQV
ncbi:MAG: hypothetical protein TREMPRED_002672 [Tremellales sp. Tagirdzhanova-0007]|nr:MAG: hypothetical protein TREMPRED_002672 [Tremellales sp. Tagirdzhanova-0007]